MADNFKTLDVGQVNHDPEGSDIEGAKPYQWYRGVFFQATVVGFCAFVAPGLWNAMQSVGAGGQQTPYLVMYVSTNAFPVRQTLKVCTGLVMLFCSH